MTVWVVIIEWNQPPSEVTGDPGLVGVYATQASAEAAKLAEQKRFDAEGQMVYQYTNHAGSHCGACGDPTDGAELKDTGSCDNDHDEWDIDVHVREAQVHP